jgi:hypothetical protein
MSGGRGRQTKKILAVKDMDVEEKEEGMRGDRVF